MDNQNYAAQFYSGISNEIGLLEKNIEEYPASSVARFMWLFHLKKNNDSRIKEVAKQTGIYLNNPLWMEYQLSKLEITGNAVNASFNELPGREEISENPFLENESSEIKNEIIHEHSEETEHENEVNLNEQKTEEEILPSTVNEEIPQNPILENESSEIKNAEIINEPSEETEHENDVNLNEQKTEEENLLSTVNEEISQNPILENESSKIKNEEIIHEPSEKTEHENGVDFNEQKSGEKNLPPTVNEEISQNPILENESSEINNEEIINEPSEETEHENDVDFNEQKTEEENLLSTVNEEIPQNPILENESSEIKNKEIINEPSEETEHENDVNLNEQKTEKEITSETVNARLNEPFGQEEISQNPILENEEDNINEDEYVIQEKPAEVNQIVSDKTFNPNENGGEEMSIPFEPLHTVDYFASQGIKLSEEALANDQLGQQVKSFTAWLKTMKKLHPGQLPEQNEVIEKIIQSSSEVSNQNANVLTEAMADVLVKQGKREKAVEMYEKLSLINPSKSAYFAAKIEILKTI